MDDLFRLFAGVSRVALAKNATVNAASDWLPGFFRASDGTYFPFDPNSILVSANPLPNPPALDASLGNDGGADAGDGGNLGEGGTPDSGSDAGPADAGPIVADAGYVPPFPYAIVIPDGGTIPFPQDAGFVAADFDGHGNVLFTRPDPTQRVGSDVIALGEPINGPRPATGYSVPFFLDSMQVDGGVTGPVLTRMDDLVCIPDILSGTFTTCYGAPATHTVACLQASTGQLVVGSGDNTANPNMALAAPRPGATAGAFNSVRTYLAPNDTATTCGPTWSTFAFPQSVFVPQPRTDSAFAGCTVLSVNRLLPVVDGSFAVGVNLDCGITAANPQWVVVRASAAGAIQMPGNGGITPFWTKVRADS